MPESRGKQSFRDFTRNVNETKGWIISAIQQGETYRLENLYQWFNDMLTVYAQFLEDEHLDYDLWFNRAVRKVENIIGDLQDKYPDNFTSDESGSEETGETNPEGTPSFDEEQDNGLFGYPFLTESECLGTDSSSRVRGQVFYTLEDLQGWLQDVPPEIVRGFIIERVDTGQGEIETLRVCAGDTR